MPQSTATTDALLPVHEGYEALLANEVHVAGVFGMHCHSCVSQNGFRPRSCNRQILLRVSHKVLEEVEVPCLFAVLYLGSGVAGVREPLTESRLCFATKHMHF